MFKVVAFVVSLVAAVQSSSMFKNAFQAASIDTTGLVSMPLPPRNLSLDLVRPADTSAIDKSLGSCTVTLVKNYTFGFSYGKPYRGQIPQHKCTDDPAYSLVYLRFSATVDRGQQFDRIAAVWIDGLELLRSTTQEPSSSVGPSWEVFKEISHYRKSLRQGSNVTIALDNIVDQTYTSYFHVTVTIEFYKKKPNVFAIQAVPKLPDLVIPIFHKNDTYPWFNVQPSSSGQNFNWVTLPRNLDSSYLELFVSHHGCDEFYYGNPPDEYMEALGSSCGSGSFREIQVLIDEEPVAAIWPFTLIYTGGLSPALWRPIVSTGAFEAPTYLVDLTPFLAKVVDGRAHNISFAVDKGVDYWPTTGNLLAYLDSASLRTKATITNKIFDTHVNSPVTVQGKDLNLTFDTSATRETLVESTILTSQGTRQYCIQQKFAMHNRQVYSNDANNEGFEHSVVVDTTTTVDFGNGMVSSQTFSEVYILTGNITFETYTVLAKTLDLSHVRIPRINAIQAAVAATTFTRLNVTIQHEFRRKLLLQGNKNLFRAGLDPYEVSITQSAASKLDSRTATTASNSVTLTSRNATGCYSHQLESANSTYTENIESYTCPRSVFIADFTTSEVDKSIWDTIWNNEVVRMISGGLLTDIP